MSTCTTSQLHSENGDDHADKLLTLCGGHHRAAHRGDLLIDGKPTTGLRFRHADASDYGPVIAPLRIDAHRQVFSALRGLGFRESQVRAALSQLRRHPDLRDAAPAHPTCIFRLNLLIANPRW